MNKKCYICGIKPIFKIVNVVYIKIISCGVDEYWKGLFGKRAVTKSKCGVCGKNTTGFGEIYHGLNKRVIGRDTFPKIVRVK